MSGFHEVGRNLEIKQKIESAVVKTIESVPEKVLKPEHIETRNQKWEGQTYPGTDVSYRKSVFVQDGRLKEGVFPEFSPVFETTLPKDMRQMSDVAQFKYCTDSLADYALRHPEFAEKFNKTQLEQILGKNPTIDGYTWHHTEHPGKMQLVDRTIHDSCRHTGGRNIWGGGTECR